MYLTAAKPDHLYRKGVGIMLINKIGQIFVGKRLDNNQEAWQMPQGGIDVGEDENIAVLRELKEETGIDGKNIKIISKSKNHYYYNLPQELRRKLWHGRYLGQKQRWYLMQFLGDDDEINVNTEHPEFLDWKWVEKKEITKMAVGFKKNLYIDVVREFVDHLNKISANQN